MMRSLYSGITGLRNHQTRMDVIGNNIANVNTTGYKYSRVVFKDLFSQMLSASGAPTSTSGGTNPKQIGLGVTLGAINVMHTNGAAQYTGYTWDMSVENDGFFIVKGSDGTNFYTRAGNFDLDNAGNLVTESGMYVMGYMPSAPTANWEPTVDASGAVTDTLAPIKIDPNYGYLKVNENGQILGIDTVGADKTEKVLGVVALGTFANNGGLEKVGGNLYMQSGNSGPMVQRASKVGTAGTIKPGTLEMSNVDLASEFTDMIVTQRGFQANSRTITTSDQMLEELVNLKR